MGNALENNVYTGAWINWTYGRVYGSTLTLTRDNGALLIAFLALYVGAAGRSFWRIVRYLLHLYFSTESKVESGVYHQRQAVLRNTQLALDATIDLILTRLAWRNRAKNLDRRLTSVALIGFFIASSFSIAGVFSSRVTSGSASDVLLRGTHCGSMASDVLQDITSVAAANTLYNNARNELASQYLAYAENCYQNPNRDTASECKIYVQKSLPYGKDVVAPCPFDPKMCILQSHNLVLDSGYLDSHEHFGLNSGPRFWWRLVRQCAPIETKHYGHTYLNKSDSAYSYIIYNYGTSSFTNGAFIRNYTHKLRTPTVIEPQDWDEIQYGDDYTITSPLWMRPIAPLNKTNGFVSLLFLQSNNVKNIAKTKDPWFSSTMPKLAPNFTGFNLDNDTYYMPRNPANVLGCTSRMQLCNPNLPAGRQCWDRKMRNVSNIAEIWPRSSDIKIMNGHLQYFQNMYKGTIETPEGYYIMPGLPALKTRYTLTGLLQPAVIPPNRWQDEMEYIFQTDLAAAQARVVELASGSQAGSREWDTDCSSPAGTPRLECYRLCNSQKVRNPGYYSFSILGICLIFILGAIIVAVGMNIERIVAFFAKYTKYGKSHNYTYAALEWQSNSTFELQRLVQEGSGFGKWSRSSFQVPVTEKEDALASLAISNANHPKLLPKTRLSIAERDRDSTSSSIRLSFDSAATVVVVVDTRIKDG